MSEDMHSLLGRYFSGQATEEEAATVMLWIRADAKNEEEFKSLEQLWNKTGEQETVSFDTNKAWVNISSKIKREETPVKKGRVFSMKAVIGIAATLVLAFIGWWMFSSSNNTQTITADTDIKEIKLEDGSMVYLRKGSSLEYPKAFEKNSRNVSLTGEAFFEITPGPERPFTIAAADAKITVIGTSFSVNTNNNQVELIVKTGKVNFGDKRRSVPVLAGQRSVYTSSGLLTLPNDDPNFDAWQTKKLVFENTPIHDVIDALNNYYHVGIRIKPEDDKQFSGITFTNTFNNQSLSSVLSDFSLLTTYRVQKINDTVYEISIK